MFTVYTTQNATGYIFATMVQVENFITLTLETVTGYKIRS